VLTVDDDAWMRRALKEVLSVEGFLVAEAARIADAVRILQAVKPGAVILDLALPERTSGPDLLSATTDHFVRFGPARCDGEAGNRCPLSSCVVHVWVQESPRVELAFHPAITCKCASRVSQTTSVEAIRLRTGTARTRVGSQQRAAGGPPTLPPGPTAAQHGFSGRGPPFAIRVA